MRNTSDDEFPLLSALGLYAADIRGDGNCLFNALSDQLYGDQSSHASIRARVIEYMREHAEYYKQFIDVHPGGGIRRNPKRKNAGAYSSPVNIIPPSHADIDRVFESHLQSMARGGTYGDNMEISAFSSAFEVDIKIYQRDFAYMVSSTSDGKERPIAHIAYHMWEHYSSIRNLDGPHTGLPEVNPRALSMEEEARQQERLRQTPVILPWQIDVVMSSLPFLADKPTIKRALEAAHGNVNNAVSALLDEQENSSSAQESSSIEREHDSDEEIHVKPNKRSTRSKESRHVLSSLAMLDGSQESVGSWDSETDSQASTFTTDLDHTSSTVKSPVRTRGRTAQKQVGPRQSQRDKNVIKKQAQKAARKERQQAEIRSKSEVQGISLRRKGLTDTPPVDILKTLFI